MKNMACQRKKKKKEAWFIYHKYLIYKIVYHSTQ